MGWVALLGAEVVGGWDAWDMVGRDKDVRASEWCFYAFPQNRSPVDSCMYRLRKNLR